MSPLWDPVDLTGIVSVQTEAMGKKEKYWVEVSDGSHWLVKLVRARQGTALGQEVLGEDWAEFLVHHLATALGLPTAVVRPASWEGARAIASLKVTRSGDTLVHGNSLMMGHVPGYDPATARHNSLYTPDNVKGVLSDVGAPRGFTGPKGLTGYDVWAGYLMLDAWVAGRDRHHENWAIIRSGDVRELAPSFDHGNSLGFAETEAAIISLVTDATKLTAWLARGKSHHFAGKPALTGLALTALGIAAPLAGTYWMERLESITPHAVDNLLKAVPPTLMSDVRRTFIAQLLAANRRRLLDEYRAQVSC